MVGQRCGWIPVGSLGQQLFELNDANSSPRNSDAEGELTPTQRNDSDADGEL